MNRLHLGARLLAGATFALSGLAAAPAASMTTAAPLATVPPAACTTVEGGNTVCHNIPDRDPVTQQNSSTSATVLIDRIISEIQGAGAGDVIRIAVYVWNGETAKLDKLRSTLKDAENAGARVEILVDAKAQNSAPGYINGLIADFTQADTGSSVTVCGDNQCLIDGASIMHNKLFLIRKGTSRTTIVSSINLTGAIETKWNNMVISKDQEMFNFYGTYFNKMQADSWGTWTTPASRTFSDTALTPSAARGYVYPQYDSHDTVANLLDSVTACTAPHNRISFIVAKFPIERLQGSTRLEQALKDLENTCEMQILIAAPDPGVISALEDLDANDRIDAKQYTGSRPHHSKYLLLDATTTDNIANNGTAVRQYVWTGSVNLAGAPSEDGPDEGMWAAPNSNILVDGALAHSVFQSHFDHLWTNP